MELQNTDPTNPTATCSGGLDQTGCYASALPQSTPPEGYNPMTLLKRESRWEQTFDVDGSLWEVREARSTKHGFDLLFGFPANSRLCGANQFGGPPRLIATPALVAYWEINRFNEGTTNDLPAGRSTMKRLRSRLRFNFVKDRRNLWKKRATDLATLPTKEFGERYNVSKEVTNQWRMNLVGPASRPLNWWHHPEALAVLRNTSLKLVEIARTLGISTSQSHRLRARAQAFDPQTVEQQPEIAGPVPGLRLQRKPTVPPVRHEGPFRHSKKQGRLFNNSEFWRPARKSQNAQPADVEQVAQPSESGHTGSRHVYSHSQLSAKRTGQLLLFPPPGGREPHPMLFQVRAFDGTFYDVYESRPTKHGFDLLFGYQTKAHIRLYAPKNKFGLIPSAALVAYWEAHRTDTSAKWDLPAGETTLKRLYRGIDFNTKSFQKTVSKPNTRPREDTQ